MTLVRGTDSAERLPVSIGVNSRADFFELTRVMPSEASTMLK